MALEGKINCQDAVMETGYTLSPIFTKKLHGRIRQSLEGIGQKERPEATSSIPFPSRTSSS
ncbi:hypothetical protein J6590_058021 [Homalodisca vitripennis]|nr:hypothetical protein J6590_058021 [Homalodisca vitripennis]